MAAAALSLTACSTGADDYCDVMTDDPNLTLAVLTPIAPDTHTRADAEEDFARWHDYVATAATDIDIDPEGVLELGTSEEMLTTGHSLLTHYDETCLG